MRPAGEGAQGDREAILLKQIKTVPSLPSVVIKLRQYLNDPDVSFDAAGPGHRVRSGPDGQHPAAGQLGLLRLVGHHQLGPGGHHPPGHQPHLPDGALHVGGAAGAQAHQGLRHGRGRPVGALHRDGHLRRAAGQALKLRGRERPSPPACCTTWARWCWAPSSRWTTSRSRNSSRPTTWPSTRPSGWSWASTTPRWRPSCWPSGTCPRRWWRPPAGTTSRPRPMPNTSRWSTWSTWRTPWPCAPAGAAASTC